MRVSFGFLCAVLFFFSYNEMRNIVLGCSSKRVSCITDIAYKFCFTMGDRVLEMGNLKYCPGDTICNEIEGNVPCIRRRISHDPKEPSTTELTVTSTNNPLTEDLPTDDIISTLETTTTVVDNDATIPMTFATNVLTEDSISIEENTSIPSVSIVSPVKEITANLDDIYTAATDIYTITKAFTLSEDLQSINEEIASTTERISPIAMILTNDNPVPIEMHNIIKSTEANEVTAAITNVTIRTEQPAEEISTKNDNINRVVYTLENIVNRENIFTEEQIDKVETTSITSTSQMITHSEVSTGPETTISELSTTVKIISYSIPSHVKEITTNINDTYTAVTDIYTIPKAVTLSKDPQPINGEIASTTERIFTIPTIHTNDDPVPVELHIIKSAEANEEVTAAITTATINSEQPSKEISTKKDNINRVVYTVENNVNTENIITEEQIDKIETTSITSTSQMIAPLEISTQTETTFSGLSTTEKVKPTEKEIRYQTVETQKIITTPFISTTERSNATPTATARNEVIVTIPTTSTENRMYKEEAVTNGQIIPIKDTVDITTASTSCKGKYTAAGNMNMLEKTTGVDLTTTTKAKTENLPLFNVQTSTTQNWLSSKIQEKENPEKNIQPVILLLMTLGLHNAATTEENAADYSKNITTEDLPTSKHDVAGYSKNITKGSLLKSSTKDEVEPTTYSCTKLKKYPSIFCNLYYECVRVMWWYQLELKTCGEGEEFHAEKLLCVLSDNCSGV